MGLSWLIDFSGSMMAAKLYKVFKAVFLGQDKNASIEFKKRGNFTILWTNIIHNISDKNVALKIIIIKKDRLVKKGMNQV